MTEKKELDGKVDIIIDGRNFTVVGPKGEQYIRKLASYVDEKVKDLTNRNEKLSHAMSATLAALNIADEYHTTKEKLEKLESQAKDPIKKYDNVISKLERAGTTIEKLELECEKYENELLKSKLDKNSSMKNTKKYEDILEIKKMELENSEKMIKSLQDKVFENQIELIETKKELGELLKKLNSEKKGFF